MFRMWVKQSFVLSQADQQSPRPKHRAPSRFRQPHQGQALPQKGWN